MSDIKYIEPGSRWSEKTLRHCLRSAETFSESDILSATQRQLTLAHLKSLMYIKDPREYQFYAQMCCIEHLLSEKLRKAIAHAREHYAKEKSEGK